MIDTENMMNIIATEAADMGAPNQHCEHCRRLGICAYHRDFKKPEPLDFTLELIRRPDGSLEWVE